MVESSEAGQPGQTRELVYPVRVYTEAGQESRGEARVLIWSRRERSLRALKGGAVCWGIACVCVFIPIAHFILVPSFLLAGPILGYRLLRQRSLIAGGSSPCPACGKNLPFVRGRDRWPLSDLCSLCQTTVKIDRAG